MSDEIVLRLLGIIEKLVDENEWLRSRPIVGPTMPPVTYPTITTTYKSPTVTCETETER